MSKKTFGCNGNTIRLRSGRYFDLADPRPEQFTMRDIAGALSKICRFGGQINDFYSVAEHCVNCAAVAKRDGQSLEVQQWALLHDAAEAFTGDIVKPLKIMLTDFSAIENAIEDAILKKFGIDTKDILWTDVLDVVREIDNAMLICEKRQLFTRDETPWAGEGEVRELSVKVKRWMPPQAEAEFLDRCGMIELPVMEC